MKEMETAHYLESASKYSSITISTVVTLDKNQLESIEEKIYYNK